VSKSKKAAKKNKRKATKKKSQYNLESSTQIKPYFKKKNKKIRIIQ